MFPYISQWLWGSTSVQDAQQPTAAKMEQDSDTESLVVGNEEEEWLLVEASADSMDKDQVALSLSQESDAASESAGSWVVAPPPCLTREDSLSEMGSLENLLIEHPSMSVYRHSLPTHTQAREDAAPPTQRAPTPLLRSQVATRRLNHGRVRQLMEAPASYKKVKVPRVDGVPRLSRKALKRHNRHRTCREAGRGQRQWRNVQPQRR